MKGITLTGKNLPRLAVAKPGWPEPNDHWRGCLESIMTRADALWDAVKAGKLNESAVDGLLRSHLDQPAFYPEWKDDLHRRAMERGGVFDQTGLSEKLRK